MKKISIICFRKSEVGHITAFTGHEQESFTILIIGCTKVLLHIEDTKVLSYKVHFNVQTNPDLQINIFQIAVECFHF